MDILILERRRGVAFLSCYESGCHLYARSAQGQDAVDICSRINSAGGNHGNLFLTDRFQRPDLVYHVFHNLL